MGKLNIEGLEQALKTAKPLGITWNANGSGQAVLTFETANEHRLTLTFLATGKFEMVNGVYMITPMLTMNINEQ